MKSGILAVSVLFCLAVIAYTGYTAVREYFPQKTETKEKETEISGILVRASENPGMFFDVRGYFEDDGNKAWIFLPETADASKLVFYTTDSGGNLLDRHEYDFTIGALAVNGLTISVMESDIPSINLSIYDNYPSLDELESSSKHAVSTKAYFDMDDYEGNIVEGIVKMRGRGNTSWKEDKKSYQISFEKSTDLLGMGEAKKWILLANAGDYSLIRNEVFLSLAKDMGLDYTPELRQVNLFINGEYRGAYSLTEKVEVGKNRVEADSGDYLYRIGMDKDEYSFLLYENPYAEGEGNYKKLYGELRDSTDEEKIKRAKKYLINAIEELYDSDSDLSLVDVDSLARYYWLQEFSKNTDPTGRSVYLRWDASVKKIYMGPAWDFDRTAGIIEMPFLDEDYIWPDGWTARVRDYYTTLFKNKTFLSAIEDVYENGGVKEAFREAADTVSERAEKMECAAEMNFTRWNVLDEDESNKVSYAYEDNSWENQINWLEDWLNMRCDWIEEEMEDGD